MESVFCKHMLLCMIHQKVIQRNFCIRGARSLWHCCQGQIWAEWQKFHFTASGSAGYASRGKRVAKKLLSGEEDIVSNGYGVSENSFIT